MTKSPKITTDSHDRNSQWLVVCLSDRIFSRSLCIFKRRMPQLSCCIHCMFSIAAITCSSQFLFYLQADYNVIKRIDSGALRFLYKLRVLILNDNLIPILPAHLFRLDSDYFTANLLLHRDWSAEVSVPDTISQFVLLLNSCFCGILFHIIKDGLSIR